jgi:hypothetical protein
VTLKVATDQPPGDRSGNPAYTPPQTAPQAPIQVGDGVRHRLSGQEGVVTGVHMDPFSSDVQHPIVEWTGDGDGFGQGYSSTQLVKF